jgi:hypothetical protein
VSLDTGQLGSILFLRIMQQYHKWIESVKSYICVEGVQSELVNNF